MSDRPASAGIGQALYGYDSGHRELVSTLPLSGEDKHTLLLFTDRAIPVNEMPTEGYLVGFPLKDTGAYALVRTWPAPEMERPGSVWSHVLFIDYALLAQLTDLSIFSTCFRRPVSPSPDLGIYQTNLELPRSSSSTVAHEIDVEAAAILLHGVYAQSSVPAEVNVSHMSSPEELVLHLWSQQWPRLRRKFKFCTLCDINKKERFSEFDLQLFRDKRIGQRSAYALESLINQSDETGRSWLSVALEDIAGEHHGLRDFLKSKASDVSDGRRHFRRLCEIYADLNGPMGGAALDRAVKQTLEAFSAQEGRLLRNEIVMSAINHVGDLPEETLRSVVVEIARSSIALSEEVLDSLLRELWQRMPELFLELGSAPIFIEAFRGVIPTLGERSIVEGLEAVPSLMNRVLPLAPQVFGSESAWSSSIGDAMLSQVPGFIDTLDEVDLINRVIPAFCNGAGPNLAERAINAFEERRFVATFLAKADLLATQTGRAISVELVTRSGASDLIEAVSGPPTVSVPSDLLVEWADIRQPRGTSIDGNVASDGIVDPWLALAKSSTSNETGKIVPMRLYSWMLLRGLRLEGTTSSELLCYAIDPVIEAMRTGGMRPADSRLFRSELVSVDWWDWVSETDRLVRTVARKARSSRFNLEQLAGLTRSDETLRMLISNLRLRSKGRRYLEKLKDQCSYAPDEVASRFERVTH